MPSQTYIPQREADLLAFVNNLAAKLAQDPAAYGQTTESITPALTAVNAFGAAYATANDPETRTSANIALKNTRKKEMLPSVRLLVQAIQVWPEMTNQKRDLLEIPVRDNEPTPIGPPEVMPKISVTSAGRILNVEVRTQDDKKRKPAGVRGVVLYSFVGAPGSSESTLPTELRQWQYEGASTKSNPQIVLPPEVAAGTPVWVTAAWMNPTDQPGPACAPTKTHVSFQGLSEAA